MYGLEFAQPAIIAEGLAQACVHHDDIREFLLTSESRANSAPAPTAMPPLLSLYQAVAADPKLVAAPRMSDANKVRDGVLVRAKEEILSIAARLRVREDELEERTAEMFDACVYVGAAAALQRWPGKGPKFDFFLM